MHARVAEATYSHPQIEVVSGAWLWKNERLNRLPLEFEMPDLKAQLGQSVQTVRRFLQRPIRVEQGNVTLGNAASSLREQAREAERQKVRLMRHDLYDLLQQHPGSRSLMRHLGMVERTMRLKGFEAVETLPVRVIAKALTQLDSLVRDWSPAGLAELRSRLAVVIKSRPLDAAREAAEAAEAAAISESMALDMAPQHAAEVSEGDDTVYAEFERSWGGKVPDGFREAMAVAKGQPSS